MSFEERKHYYCNYICNNYFVLKWIDHSCVCPLKLGSNIGLDFVEDQKVEMQMLQKIYNINYMVM